MSIMPLDVEAPTKMPSAATVRMVRNLAAFVPTAGLRKFTASLATPTERSKVASRHRNMRIPKYIKSIRENRGKTIFQVQS